MKNKEVVKAFEWGKAARSSTGNLWSSENCLYSYNTCIAEYDKYNRLYVNLTQYSNTTSHHQSLIKRYLIHDIYKTVHKIDINQTHIIPKNERN